MNEDDVRNVLAGAATAAWDDDVRASSSLYAGRRLLARRRWLARAVGGSVLAMAGAAATVVLLPGSSAPSTQVVLGCTHGVGAHGDGVVTAGVGGVTLSVDNRTSALLAVNAGSATAFAVPGSSQVTVPVGQDPITVRCGRGDAVRLRVQRVTAAHCSSVSSALDASIQRGSLDELTRARLGALPDGAVVDTPEPGTPLQRVEVRSGDVLVAEAVWHAMPGTGDWHLESLSRCS